MQKRLTAEFGMGSGLIAPQKSPGRRKAERKQTGFMIAIRPRGGEMDIGNESVQANRAISTGKLHTLLCFHIRPINVVVFHGS